MEQNPVPLTPFELDIAAQPDALRQFAATVAAARGRRQPGSPPSCAPSMTASSSPGWDPLISRRCPAGASSTAAGRSIWWIDTGQLLDSPRLITPDSLLVITSQSGASGEITALLDPAGDQPVRPRAVVGITNDAGSPLARSV